jgi:uncharacterized protein YraI
VILSFWLAGLGVKAVAAQSSLVVFVPELVKVRVGPGTVYDQVGELTAGQTAAALGRSQFNDWVQIEFASSPTGRGWVYAKLIELQGGTIDQLPLAEAPPTATLPPTPVGDSNPSLATPSPTRLPTFTPAPPVVIPTYENSTPSVGGFPSALLILGLLAIGLVGAVLAVIRRNA